jgi:hypothetical protein
MTARFNGAEIINGALVKLRTEEGTVKRTIAIWTRDAQRVQPISVALKADFGEYFYHVSHEHMKRKFEQKRKGTIVG